MSGAPAEGPAASSAGERPKVDAKIVDELLEQAGEGVQLLGPDGLLTELTKSVLERALAAELTDHLGYDPAGGEPQPLHLPEGRVRLPPTPMHTHGRHPD